MDDDEATYEPEDGEVTLYHLLAMVDGILDQVRWLQIIIEEEIERVLEKES